MRGSIWLLVIAAIIVLTVVLRSRRGRPRRRGPVALTGAAALPSTATAMAAAEVLAAMDARPAGVPLDAEAPDADVRRLFVLRPASLLVPFDDPSAGALRGVSVARGSLLVTNRYLRFDADGADDVVWPVDDIRELRVVPEGLFIGTEGLSTQRGVGVGPEWVALLPVLVEWASALEGDDALDSIRARVSGLAQGSQTS